jgi:uncharacterized protein
VHIPDVNVLVDAWTLASPHHEPAKQWLEGHATAGSVGLPDAVAAGVVRILTLDVPGLGADVTEVLDLCTALRSARGVQVVRPGPRHWRIFDDLCRRLRATGNTIPDCYLAALAIEHDATFVSRDRFFEQVPGLDWTDLPAH